jgi:hypothetical protein
MATKRTTDQTVREDMEGRQLPRIEEEEAAPLGNDEELQNYSFRARPSDMAKIEAWARKRGLKRATAFRYIILEYIRTNKL